MFTMLMIVANLSGGISVHETKFATETMCKEAMVQLDADLKTHTDKINYTLFCTKTGKSYND